MRPLAWFTAAVIVGLGVSAVAGCASAPTVQDFAAACDAYGFQRGTPDWSQCLQTEALRADGNRAAKSAALMAMGASLQQQSQTMALQRSMRQQTVVAPYTPTFRCFQMAGYVQCR